jgi:2-polyprenyl-6-methoxyphenol hydroxylase-like FAD-dependent oxidoreductase
MQSEAQNLQRNQYTYRKAILRFALLEQLGGHDKIKWGHQLVDLKEVEGETVELSFEVSGEVKIAKADLVVGADGIRSSVRKLLIGDRLPFALPRLYCDIGNLSFSCSQRY